jgi:pyridoxamine 5'-phosphate oxidase
MGSIDSFQLQQDSLFHSLSSIELDSWQRLSQGSLSSKSDFNLTVIGTVKNHEALLRTVVVRKVWVAEKQLAFYTDIRSKKVVNLVENPAISFLFYSKTHRIQLRLLGSATIHNNNDLAISTWLQTNTSNRKSYLTLEPPGSISPGATSGLPGFINHKLPTEEESMGSKKNFAVIITKIKSLEWLWLNNGGHRRAVFEYENNRYKANWLIP